MRAALSTTRAPILSRFFLRVANSAPGERHPAGHGIAEREHQPVGRGVQDEAELVGDRALAGGPVGGELALVQLDEVLGLAAGAVDTFLRLTAGRSNRRRVSSVMVGVALSLPREKCDWNQISTRSQRVTPCPPSHRRGALNKAG